MRLYELLLNGQAPLFFLIVLAIVISLTFHEFGHAAIAKLFGDDTAQRMGRLTLNPLAHIDPIGLLMVIIVGIGFAKPVPINPNKFTSRWADLLVSAAGPGMNLVLAVAAVNLFVFASQAGWSVVDGRGPQLFFEIMIQINLMLMLFNLIPLGPLDGHYMLPYLLTRKWAYYYRIYNAQYGYVALLVLFALSVVGLPVFAFIFSLSAFLLPWIVFV